MFCAQCGCSNDDNNFKCTQCGAVLVRTDGEGTGAGRGFGQRVDDGWGSIGDSLGPARAGLADAIIVTLLCCLPFGIPAIVYASQTMSHNSAGNYVAAHETSKKAKMWSYISLGVGLLTNALLIFGQWGAASGGSGYFSVP